jgi:hypothetical protein
MTGAVFQILCQSQKPAQLFRRQITGHYSSTDNKFYAHNSYVDN